jgi:hypothetical protein
VVWWLRSDKFGLVIAMLGIGFVFYWVAANILAWLIRITAEDIQNG